MKYKRTLVFFLVFFFCFFFSLEVSAEKKYKEGEIIVKYKKDKIDLKRQKGEADRLERERAAEKKDEIEKFNIRLIKSYKTTEELLSEFENDPNIEYVEPNYFRTPSVTPNDSSFSSQWALNNTGQLINGYGGTSDADIDAPEAWDSELDVNSDAVVAVIDSGVNFSHDDLSANMWHGSACKNENGNPIAGGCPNHGWDYENNDDNPSDNLGHGTHVSGIIGAVSDNSIGISGISYKNKVKIMALRFGFDSFSEIKAINFAEENGADIINASYAGVGYLQSEKNAIDNFSGVFVVAAGNGGNDNIGPGWDNDAPSQSMYPCNYTSSNIICVAATNQDDDLASFSNFGATSVDVTAPGANILSTYIPTSSSYVYSSGTSMATPYVAGIAAMVYSSDNALQQSEVIDAILNSGDNLLSLQSKTTTEKRVNLQNIQGYFLNTIPIYGLYNKRIKSYFYTTSLNRKNYYLQFNGWSDIGTVWRAFSTQEPNTIPVYRIRNKEYRFNFYTSSLEQKNCLDPRPNWQYVGIAWYVYDSPHSNTVPVYHLHNKVERNHFMTSSTGQRACIDAKPDWYIYRNPAYWVPIAGANQSTDTGSCDF